MLLPVLDQQLRFLRCVEDLAVKLSSPLPACPIAVTANWRVWVTT